MVCGADKQCEMLTIEVSGGADVVLLGSNEPNKFGLFSIKSLSITLMNPLV
jgi:hypothetical protein